VKRVAPRLVDALDRAVNLATNTLRYGRAEERKPQRTRFLLGPLMDEVASSALPEAGEITLEKRIPQDWKSTPIPNSFSVFCSISQQCAAGPRGYAGRCTAEEAHPRGSLA
jgi:hypothetical protein